MVYMYFNGSLVLHGVVCTEEIISLLLYMNIALTQPQIIHALCFVPACCTEQLPIIVIQCGLYSGCGIQRVADSERMYIIT